MYVAKDNQRLYLDSWSYNAALVLTELAKIVWNNGGRVKPVNKALITNRSLSEIIDKYQNSAIISFSPREARVLKRQLLINASALSAYNIYI